MVGSSFGNEPQTLVIVDLSVLLAGLGATLIFVTGYARILILAGSPRSQAVQLLSNG